MLVKCSNIENIDSIFKKCIIQVCDFQCYFNVSVVFFALNYVKCIILIYFVETNLFDDLRKNNSNTYNSDVVCWRQDNDEIKC